MMRKIKTGVWLGAALLCLLGGIWIFYVRAKKSFSPKQEVSAETLINEEPKLQEGGGGEPDREKGEEALTRKDLAMLLFRLGGRGNIFESSAGNESTKEFQEWLLQAKGDYIIEGSSYFENPDAQVSHQEFYYVLGRYLEPDLKNDLKELPDERTAEWAKPYIAQFHAWGFLDAKSRDFEPGKLLDKAEYQKLLKGIFALQIEEAKTIDAKEHRGKFIILNAAGGIRNFDQGFLILTPALSGGKIKIFDSSIERLYIQKESKNIEIQLSKSRFSSLQNRGEQIRMIDLSSNDPAPELPGTDTVKPRLPESQDLPESALRQEEPRESQADASPKESGAPQKETLAKSETGAGERDKSSASSEGGSSFGKHSPRQGRGKTPKERESLANPQESLPEAQEPLPEAQESLPNPQESSPGSGDLPEIKEKELPKEGENPRQKAPQESKETPKKEEGEKPGESEEKEKLSREFIILNERTRGKGELVYLQGEETKLPQTALIGLRASGENGGREYELIWGKEGLPALSNAPKGKYELNVSTKEDLIINGKNYGKVKFAVDLIIE